MKLLRLQISAVLAAMTAGLLPCQGQILAGAASKLNQAYEVKRQRLLADERARKDALLTTYRRTLADMLGADRFPQFKNAIEREIQAATGPELEAPVAGLPLDVTRNLRQKLETAWRVLEAGTERSLLTDRADQMSLLIQEEVRCLEAKDVAGQAEAQAAQKELIQCNRPRLISHIEPGKDNAIRIFDFAPEPDRPLPALNDAKDRWCVSPGAAAAAGRRQEFAVVTSGGNSFLFLASESNSSRLAASCSINVSSDTLPQPALFKKVRFGCRFRVRDRGDRGTGLGLNLSNLGAHALSSRSSIWCTHRIELASFARDKWIETRSDWLAIRHDPNQPVTISLGLVPTSEVMRKEMIVSYGGNGKIDVDDVFIEFSTNANLDSH